MPIHPRRGEYSCLSDHPRIVGHDRVGACRGCRPSAGWRRRLLSTLVALTDDNRLLRFASDNAGKILAATPIRGLTAGESSVGIDVRPGTGRLYGLGRSGNLYTIGGNTGQATLRAALAAEPSDATDPFTSLAGTDFGVDFDPAADRLRVVERGAEPAGQTPTPARSSPTRRSPSPRARRTRARTPTVVDAAYSNNVPAAPGSPTTPSSSSTPTSTSSSSSHPQCRDVDQGRAVRQGYGGDPARFRHLAERDGVRRGGASCPRRPPGSSW